MSGPGGMQQPAAPKKLDPDQMPSPVSFTMINNLYFLLVNEICNLVLCADLHVPQTKYFELAFISNRGL
jgi:hypothetical protein